MGERPGPGWQRASVSYRDGGGPETVRGDECAAGDECVVCVWHEGAEVPKAQRILVYRASRRGVGAELELRSGLILLDRPIRSELNL